MNKEQQWSVTWVQIWKLFPEAADDVVLMINLERY